MAITLRQLIHDAQQAAGSSMDPRLDETQIVNEAGQYLFGMHSWAFRGRPVATASFVADQAWVALPSDFGTGEVKAVLASDALSEQVNLTTLDEVEYLRSALNIASPSIYYVALEYPTQVSEAVAPAQARLSVYPTPGATEADALKIIYRAGWVDLSAKEDTANVPPFMEGFLRRCVRAHSKAYTTDDFRHVDGLGESPEFLRIRRMDGASQSDIGAMAGGILDSVRAPSHNWNFTTSGP